ncbi:MAG: preprotein translocase subunit SecY, partial [Pseudomonadota bacterium]
MPQTIAGFSADQSSEWLQIVSAALGRGQPLFLAIFIGLIVFFCFFYTAVVFNPDDVAENLKKQGGFVPGIRPGKKTAEYLDYVLTRLTVVGAIYLAAICALPEILISRLAVPFYFGGTSVLIVVSVTMDTISQVQSHLLAHQYEGLIEKSRLGGKNRAKARATRKPKGRKA